MRPWLSCAPFRSSEVPWPGIRVLVARVVALPLMSRNAGSAVHGPGFTPPGRDVSRQTALRRAVSKGSMPISPKTGGSGCGLKALTCREGYSMASADGQQRRNGWVCESFHFVLLW